MYKLEFGEELYYYYLLLLFTRRYSDLDLTCRRVCDPTMILKKNSCAAALTHTDNKKKEKLLTPLSFLTPFEEVRGGDFLNK